MTDEAKVVVRFTRAVSIYNAGEIAGFSPAVAQAYVDAGAAEVYTPPTPQQSKAQAETIAARADDPRSDLTAFSKGKDTSAKGRKRK
jgi:hypothetical protein